MSVRSCLRRQWIPIKGGSCDVRMGPSATEEASKILASAVGKPKRCLVVTEEATDADYVELLRRQVTDAGFAVSWVALPEGVGRTLEASTLVTRALFEGHLTSDDLCVVVGDADTQAVAAHAVGAWCGGLSVVAFPTSEVALLEGVLTPRALDFGGSPEMISVTPCVRRVIFDEDFALSELDSERSAHLRALMAGAAVSVSERDFSALWDRAEALMAGDENVLVDQLLATAKTRGQIVSSSAAAVRQSAGYGELFARAVAGVAKDTLPHSALLAEGMRFAARVSVVLDKLSIDDMLAQDELLTALGLGSVTCDVDPEALVAAIRNERFLRSNRLMLLLPLSLGRVRLTAVPAELLEEHVAAWCAAHASER